MLGGSKRHLTFTAFSYFHRLVSLEKKRGNRTTEAAGLDGSQWEVGGILGVAEATSVGLR